VSLLTGGGSRSVSDVSEDATEVGPVSTAATTTGNTLVSSMKYLFWTNVATTA
jgi:hypothetical protein